MFLHVRFFGLLVCLCTGLLLECRAQAAYLALGVPSKPDTLLEAKGGEGLRRAHFKVGSATASGTLRWSWFGEKGSAPDTLRTWRPAVANRSITGFDQLVLPDTTNVRASALYMDSLGAPGLLPGISANTWLHFRITTSSKPASAVDEWMSVCTTNFEPARICRWQIPDTIAPGSNAFVKLWFDRQLSAGEWAGVEFDTAASMQTARRIVLGQLDSLCSGFLPCFDAGKRIWLRFFTCQVSLVLLDSLFEAHGPLASRLLSLDETGARSDSIVVSRSAGLFGNYLIPGTCFSRLEAFVDTLNRRGMSGPLTCHVKAGHREKLNSGSGLQLKIPGHPVHSLRFISAGIGPKPLLIAGMGSRGMNSSSTRIDGIWSIHGTDNLTIEGFELVDSNAASSGSARMEFGLALFKDSLNGGCCNVRIANCRVRFMALMSSSGPSAFEDGNKGIALVNARADALNQAFTVTGSHDLHTNILLEEDTISTAFAGILTKGMSDNSAPYKRLDSAVVIRKCAIWNFGEEGIKVMNVRDALLEDNHIHTHPHGNTPLAVPVSERFGIVFSSGHLYSESGIRIIGNRITLGGRALSGSQHLFGIVLRQNAGTSNRMEVRGNVVRSCTNQMQGSTFYGIRNTGQRHTLVIDSNMVYGNRLASTGSHVIAISNSAQIHHALRITNNKVSRDTLTGDYTGILHIGQARFVLTIGNCIDSIGARGRATGIQLHSIGAAIRADSNRIVAMRAAGGVTGISLRCLSTSGTSSGSIHGNTIHKLTTDSIGNVIGIDLNNGHRHKAELHANCIAGLHGNGRISGIAVRSLESQVMNNRIAGLDGLSGSQAQVSGLELFPGIASLHHNTIYLRGSHADSNRVVAVFRWNDSAGSRLLLKNNVMLASGVGHWQKPVAFLKSRSGLDTNRINPQSSGNYFHAAGSGGQAWLYFNQTDNSGDSQVCNWYGRLSANNLSNVASGGVGDMVLDETLRRETFLKRKTGNLWPRLIQASQTLDALGRTRTNPSQQIPGALMDTFTFDIDRQFSISAQPNRLAIFAPLGQTDLASWTVKHLGRTMPGSIKQLAFSIDSSLLADSLILWVKIHPDTSYRHFGSVQPAGIESVFADSMSIACGDSLGFKLSGVLSCNPTRKDSVFIKLSYLVTSKDSLVADARYGVCRLTPRNKAAAAISGKDTLCPGTTAVWKRLGGQLEPAGQWLWLDADSDSLLGTGDSLRLQLNAGRRFMLRGAGYCDTTIGRVLSLSVYTLPAPANKVRADRDTLCLGVPNWFYPSGGNKGSGGVWSWYVGANADSFLHSGDALQFSLRQPDTLFLRAEAWCGNSDWVHLPLAVRHAARFDWIGNSSDSWHQAANWCDQVPGKNDTVRIGGKQAFMPRISATAAAGTLVLDSGARLELDSGVRLFVHGNLQARAADLTGHGATLIYAAGDTLEWKLPAQLAVDTLVVAGAALQLTGKTQVKQLVLERGVLISSPDTIELELPVMEGKANKRFSESWIHGPIVQRLGWDSGICIPSGDLHYAMPVSLQFRQPGSISELHVHYRDRPGNDSGLTASEFGIGFNFLAGAGVWFISAEPDTARTQYDLQLWFDGHPDYEHYLQDGAFTILRRHDSSRNAADWTLPAGSFWPGKDSAGTRVAHGYALRKGITGFSQFGIAGAAAVLPIGIHDFKLKCIMPGSKVQLDWKMDPEAGITHFVIEQLIDGKWFPVGKVSAQSEDSRSDYQYHTTGLAEGRHFFRVQALSDTLCIFTSPLRFCDIEGAPVIRAIPNPFGDWLRLVLPSEITGKAVHIVLSDLQGRKVYHFTGSATASHAIDTRNLVAGWYSLVVCAVGDSQSIRIPVFKQAGM
jgi:hypothetical protein